MSPSVLKFITFVVVAIIIITCLLIFLHNRKVSRLKKYISFLDKEKNLLESAPIVAELSKVETLIKNDKMEEKYKLWQEQFEKIKNDEISHLNDCIFNLDSIIEKHNYSDFNSAYSLAELQLYCVRTKIDKLLGEIQEINQSEEKYRDLITKLKSKYRELNDRFEREKSSYEGIEEIVDLQFENIEKRFQDFEQFMDKNEYSEVIHIVKAIDTMIEHMSIVVEEAPDLVLLSTKLIPKRIEQISETYEQMKKDEYPLDYLNIEYNVEEALKNVNKIFDRIKVLNLEDCMFELKTMLEYLDSLFEEFEKERIARKEYEDAKGSFEDKLNKTNSVVKEMYGQIENIKNTYDLNEDEIKSIDNINLELKSLKKEYKKELKKLATNKTPYSKMSQQLEESSTKLKDIEDQLDVSMKSLGNMYEDEERAHEQLNEIQELLAKSKLKIRNYKLPIISNIYFVQLREANEAIVEVIKELENKPIDIKTLNTRVDTARDLVLKLYNTTKEMINNASLAENLIVYGNRYRFNNTRVNEGLNSAEQLFNKGQYDKSLIKVLSVLETVDPEIKRKVGMTYVK